MIDTILFDLDGTLLDTLCDLQASVNYALSCCGLPERSKEEVRAFVGNGAATLMLRAAPCGCDEKVIKKLLRLFEEHYKVHSLDRTAPYDGILPLLDALETEGFQMAVVSNKPFFATEDLVRRFFGKNVSVAVGQRSSLPKKPAPDMIFEAMRLLNKSPEQCLYVGDSEVDVECAKNAGIPLLAVDWGFRSSDQLQKAGAQTILSTPQSLFHQLLQLRSERTS
jgi:phosphoglycolate phosphatase